MSTRQADVKQYKPPQGVYFLYQCGKLVYIGETNDIYRRISEHAHGRTKPNQKPKTFDSWRYIRCEDQATRKTFESYLINLLHPIYNEDYRYRYKGTGGSVEEEMYHTLSHSHEVINTLRLAAIINGGFSERKGYE